MSCNSRLPLLHFDTIMSTFCFIADDQMATSMLVCRGTWWKKYRFMDRSAWNEKIIQTQSSKNSTGTDCDVDGVSSPACHKINFRLNSTWNPSFKKSFFYHWPFPLFPIMITPFIPTIPFPKSMFKSSSRKGLFVHFPFELRWRQVPFRSNTTNKRIGFFFFYSPELKAKILFLFPLDIDYIIRSRPPLSYQQ